MHHDEKGHNALKHYATRKGLGNVLEDGALEGERVVVVLWKKQCLTRDCVHDNEQI